MEVSPLSEIINPSTYGDKAASLSFLKRNGFNVPPGFALSTNWFWAYKNGELVESTLRALIQTHINPTDVEGYMIRSSAIGEDSASNSFAGQLDSFISAPTTDAILENIYKCWQSYDKANVKAYEKLTGKKLEGMGVIIQQLIQPDYAGVVFSRSHHQAGEMLAEMVKGHGEQLVSGKITPISISFHISSGKQMNPISPDLSALFGIVRKIELRYKQAVDVEWVMKGNEFYIVQARPITTKIQTKKIFWSNTNVNENYPGPISPLLYSIARDSYYHYFKNLAKMFRVSESQLRALEGSFSNIIGIFGCRMYYNMSSIHSILSSSPFSDTLIKSFDNFVGYEESTESSTQHAGTLDKISFLREFIRLNRQLQQQVISFEKMANEYTGMVDKAIVHEEVKNCFHHFVEIRMHSWHKASMADFFAMAYHGLLGKLCKKYYPQAHEGIHNKLIQAIPGLISTQPIIEMYQIISLIRKDKVLYESFLNLTGEDFYNLLLLRYSENEITNAIRTYLFNWGFRCSGELMLTELTYTEKPALFIELLQQYEKMPDQDPFLLIQQKHKEAWQTKKEVFNTILRKKWYNPFAAVKDMLLLNLLIAKASSGISSRERVRLKQALLYFKFKQVIHKIGIGFRERDLLTTESDILFLKYQEIAENLSASDMLPGVLKTIVNNRKDRYNLEKLNSYPDDFYTRDGEYCSVDFSQQENASLNETGSLKGMCACGGKIKGKAKVLNSILEAHKLEKGDILVTRQTDPGWVVVFPLIKGLIVERGGMLSHGAIVSREFGIPALVGVNNATLLIKDGDTLILDADIGIVNICH